MNTFITVIIMIVLTIIGAFGSYFLKKGSVNAKLSIRHLISNYYLIAGLFLYGLVSLIFIWLLKTTELSFLYSLTSFTYVWVAFIALIFLKERMTSLKWIGTFLILLGVILVTIVIP